MAHNHAPEGACLKRLITEKEDKDILQKMEGELKKLCSQVIKEKHKSAEKDEHAH